MATTFALIGWIEDLITTRHSDISTHIFTNLPIFPNMYIAQRIDSLQFAQNSSRSANLEYFLQFCH